MKRKISIQARLMIITSVLLVLISMGATLFSIYNAAINIIKPFEKMYLDEQNGVYNQRLVEIINSQGNVVIYANDFFITSIIFMIILILIGSGLTYLVAKFSLEPIRKWSEEISRIDKNELSKRIENSNTGDELDSLANSFNQLLDRLQSAFDREKRFSAAAAHELKTPLTVVKANIEFLQIDEDSTKEDYIETIEVIKKQNERMIKLVDDLMFISLSNMNESMDLVDIDDIIDEIKNELEVKLYAKNIRFEYNKNHFRIRGNPVLIKHALSNLIENSIKYNIENGKILLSQIIEDNQYKIIISDTGIGVKEEDIPYIFEPFYRADKSRKRSVGGAGLGLSITKEIIESHKGHIEYTLRKPNGSIFMITLPINNL
ncbi:MAG: HAMP domain-containing sensor histidine kinase [Romboutsia sp.]